MVAGVSGGRQVNNASALGGTPFESRCGEKIIRAIVIIVALVTVGPSFAVRVLGVQGCERRVLELAGKAQYGAAARRVVEVATDEGKRVVAGTVRGVQNGADGIGLSKTLRCGLLRCTV